MVLPATGREVAVDIDVSGDGVVECVPEELHQVLTNLVQNAKTAQQIIAGAVERLPFDRSCECASALKYALITRPEAVPAETKRNLAPLVAKYLQA